MSELLRDFRLAIRVLARSTSFTIVTVLTLAVAIGATSAIFSVVNAVLLQPLPYPDAGRIVTVSLDATKGGVPELPFSDRGYWHFVNKSTRFAGFGGWGSQQVPLTGTEGAPQEVTVGAMTRSAFDVLRVAPLRGRLPSAEEDAPNGPVVALVSERLWRSRFGADPALIGKTIDLNGLSREVIGIMRDGYDFPSPDVDVWVPFQLDPASQNFGGHHIEAIARLATGATIKSATADAESLIRRFGEAGYGPEWLTNVFSGRANIRSYQETLVGDVRKTLLVLLGTVGFVLLIACSNVANLFLLRSEARTREVAIRIALGARRGMVIRYVLAESLVLALTGGAAGIALAYFGTRALVALAPPAIPRLHEISITPGVLLFTFGISLFSGLLFGVLPALRSFSPHMNSALHDGGRGSTVGRERHGARHALVVAEVSLALLLLVGAGLMFRSFQRLRAVDPGFSPDAVLTFRVSPPPNRYNTAARTMQFYDQLLAGIRGLPGVAAAGAITELPLSGGGTILATTIEGFPIGPGEFPPTFAVRRVTPGYFAAMRIPVIEGRVFDDRDHQQRLGTAVISQAIKKRFWPNDGPLGRHVTPSSAPARIVGVVGDVHQNSLEEAPDATIYLPMVDSAGGGVRAMVIAIRATRPPESLIAAVRRQVHDLDPDLPVTNLRTMDVVVGRSMNRTSFAALLLGLAAAIGLFLGAVGIYGVISYTVRQRTIELGIRQALGATAGAIRTMVVRQGVTLAAIGMAIGLVAAVALGRVMRSLLFGVSEFDLATFAGGCVVFLLVSVLACLVPALRASRIAPSQALRDE